MEDWSQRNVRQKFYSSKQWKQTRDFVLQSQPLCRKCEAYGYLEPATCVDHIIDIKDRPELRLDLTNLQPLCDRCHSRKTALSNKKNVKGDFDESINKIKAAWNSSILKN